MSTDDDFEARLRARLHDLADREDDWDDPTAAAREYAAAGIAPDDDPAVLPLPTPPARRRPWTVLAVAAVLLAVLVGGGLGLRELTRSGTGASAASAGSESGGQAYGAAPERGGSAPASVPAPTAASGGAAPGGGSQGSCPVGATGCTDTAVCNDLGPARSTGPLADIGTVRLGGIVGPQVAPGESTGIPVVLSFASDGPTVELRAPRVVLVENGRLVPTGGLTSDLIQSLDVTAGTGDSGSISFQADSCQGTPLMSGRYEVAVVYPYRVQGGTGAESYLVSAPLAAVVS